MEKITVRVTETLVREVTVSAVCKDEAYDMVRQQYRDQEIVLDESDMLGEAEFEVLDSKKGETNVQ